MQYRAQLTTGDAVGTPCSGRCSVGYASAAPPADPKPVITATNPREPGQQQHPLRQGHAAERRDARGTSGSSPTPAATASGGAEAARGQVHQHRDPDSRFLTTRRRRSPRPSSSTERSPACSDPFTYVEDPTAPETTIDSGPSGSTTDATPTYGFSSPEPGASFQCRFDAAAFGPCSGPGNTHTPANDLGSGPARLRGQGH